ncbi:hypothetical protein BDV96DRAFT_582106 [Lophiotrema nucula]|uniref:Uncharacterized protein n=1 Tax=Lophiotrema nucula TaxID=690887 RepID=A0A6A5YWE7_9PLEO|nr:hypothetical protein BDV96DRAFT_582106 [Lophiotrema nucula]
MFYDYFLYNPDDQLIYRRYAFHIGPVPYLTRRSDERTLTPQGVLRIQPRHQQYWPRYPKTRPCPWSWNEMQELRTKSYSMFKTRDLLSNAAILAAFVGAATVFEQYLALITFTNEYIARIERLARLEVDRLYAGSLLVDFTISVLREERGGLFEQLLNSQRARIYHMIDEALLRVCLDEWENEDRAALPWNQAIRPLARALSRATELIPSWAKADWADMARYKSCCNENLSDNGAWMEAVYFNRTRKMLEESLELYWVKKKIHACVQQRLPEELIDGIVQNVLAYERLPTGRLRTRYFPKGKEKQ